jgi:chromatin segregation and condensation protein Rec8/ScpA/Scc1 (kleisin family)
MRFSHLAPSKEEKLASFVPVLHLSNDGKMHIWQDEHFDDIHLGFDMHENERRVLEAEVGFNEGTKS